MAACKKARRMEGGREVERRGVSSLVIPRPLLSTSRAKSHHADVGGAAGIVPSLSTFCCRARRSRRRARKRERKECRSPPGVLVMERKLVRSISLSTWLAPRQSPRSQEEGKEARIVFHSKREDEKEEEEGGREEEEDAPRRSRWRAVVISTLSIRRIGITAARAVPGGAPPTFRIAKGLLLLLLLLLLLVGARLVSVRIARREKEEEDDVE